VSDGVSQSSRGLEYFARRFYERFAKQRSAFLSQIYGNVSCSERDSYGSLIVNRIMFLYFVQAAGFLDHDPHYLTNKLRQVQKREGGQAFYSHFLLPLFREGMSGSREHLERETFGDLPALGAELFPPHTLENQPYRLHIPDEAFAQLFTFLDEYRWCLDEHSAPAKIVVTPPLMGAVFELYINQRQIGAYYTHSDVTGYIAQNTILPSLLETVLHSWVSAGQKVSDFWLRLQQEPDRYISPIIRSEEPLPDETMRECQLRRAQCAILRTRLRVGELSAIEEMITWNLDLQRFLIDSIHAIESPALLSACYEKIRQITILDPTCGSGAFLFSALDVLVPLHEACFERAQELSLQMGAGKELHKLQRLPIKRYQILKMVMTENLYGVDIMEEAIEICRLRFVLRLLSHLKRIKDIEPLPILNDHLQIGNALCDFCVRYDNRERTQKEDVGTSEKKKFSWQVAFPQILAAGGFSVIIGNPPYVEYSEGAFPYILRDFVTLPCSNLYPCVIERSRQLLTPGGWHGMVVPLAAFATRNMQPFLDGFRCWFPCSWVSFYHFRPAMLFSGGKVASIPTAIYLARAEGPEQRYSTSLLKWTHEQRQILFSRLAYCKVTAASDPMNRHYYPKFGQTLENGLMEKVRSQQLLREYLADGPGENTMFYRSAGGLYWKVFVNFPWPYPSTSNKQCTFREPYLRDIFVAVLNSSLFWWYYTVTFDTFNLKDYMLFGFRFTYPSDSRLLQGLSAQCKSLMEDFQRNARHLKRAGSGSYTIYAKKSKPIIDEIDCLLAAHYGFTVKELDFILHYDENYRLGDSSTD
jgi:hypothetical protein